MMNTFYNAQRIIKRCYASIIARKHKVRELYLRHTSKVNPTPILVFGNQKSGTTAITALLGEAIGASYTIDIFYRYRGLEEQLLQGQRGLDDLVRVAQYYFSKDIIKEPSLTLFYDALTERLPTAQRIFILRDPRQNIRSILNRLQIPGNLPDLPSEQLERLRIELPNWYLVMDGSLAGHRGATYIDTLALRCKRMFQTYLTHQDKCIAVKYEDFNRNKVDTIYDLSTKLGYPIKKDIYHLQNKQFQSKGDQAIALTEFFGRSNLKRIEQICADEMSRLGYE